MNKNLKKVIVIATYICAFILLFNDWLLGLSIGTALGVALTDGDNDKSCCK